jgi:hypothetical protein
VYITPAYRNNAARSGCCGHGYKARIGGFVYVSVYETVVRGGLQAVSEEKALQKLYQTLNE